MAYKHLDDGDRAEVWRFRGAGHNTNEISKLTGRAYATVATLLKAAVAFVHRQPRSRRRRGCCRWLTVRRSLAGCVRVRRSV